AHAQEAMQSSMNSSDRLLTYTSSPSAFLDAFLEDTPSSRSLFDNHNVSILEFLQNADGEVDPCIEVYPVCKMDLLVRSLGLSPVAPDARRNVTRDFTDGSWLRSFSDSDHSRIARRYEKDVDWFERHFSTLELTHVGKKEC
ncbi:MAG: hypothetical protein WCN98_12345, partial [Verrucomicrobiaceae bacterium]